MPRFRFNLQAVLKQRLAIERQRQSQLGVYEQQRLALEHEIRGYQETLLREKSDLREALLREKDADYTQGVDLRVVRLQANAALHVVAKAQQAVLRLAAVHRKLDEARRALLEATTARKGVETLRDRRYEAWQSEQNRRETSVLDELAVMRAARAGNEPLDSNAAEHSLEAA